MKGRILKTVVLVCFIFIIQFLIPDTSLVYSVENYSLLDAKVDVDLNKSWTINVNNELEVATVNKGNIKIYDESEKPVDIEVTLDNKTNRIITVRPLNNYEQGKTYHLTINQNVKSKKGKSLSKGAAMYFTTKQFGSGSANVKKTTVNLGGKSISFIDISVLSTNMSSASMVKVDNNDFLFKIGETQRFMVSSSNVTIYLYSNEGDYVGTGSINITSDGKVNFEIDRSGGII